MNITVIARGLILAFDSLTPKTWYTPHESVAIFGPGASGPCRGKRNQAKKTPTATCSKCQAYEEHKVR